MVILNFDIVNDGLKWLTFIAVILLHCLVSIAALRSVLLLEGIVWVMQQVRGARTGSILRTNQDPLHRNRVLSSLLKLLNLRHRHNLLEVGCLPACLLNLLLTRTHQVVAISSRIEVMVLVVL